MLLFDDVAIHYILSAAQSVELLLCIIPLQPIIFTLIEWCVCVCLITGQRMDRRYARSPHNHSKSCEPSAICGAWKQCRRVIMQYIHSVKM